MKKRVAAAIVVTKLLDTVGMRQDGNKRRLFVNVMVARRATIERLTNVILQCLLWKDTAAPPLVVGKHEVDETSHETRWCQSTGGSGGGGSGKLQVQVGAGGKIVQDNTRFHDADNREITQQRPTENVTGGHGGCRWKTGQQY